MQEIKIPNNMLPVYADEVKLDIGIKVNVAKDKKGKEIVRKEAKFDLVFFDGKTQSAVARIVLDSITAQKLGNILSMQSAKVMDELRSTEIPKEVRKQMKKGKEKVAASQGYIG